MKVKGMCDQYKMSIEARPLQVLYTKYNPCDVISHFQSVRPLGRIRKERRPSSEQGRGSRCTDADGRMPPVNATKDMKLNNPRRNDNERINNKFKSDQNISSLDFRENTSLGLQRENTAFPAVNLTKSQAFENKFKIAASRHTGTQSESPPLRQNKVYDKKVVHLPLFQVNLKTYTGESEVSRTVAKTRESLRKLMELHKSKMKTNSVVTANIRNYEFNAPVSSVTNTSRSCDAMYAKPFHAKPALRSSRGNRDITSKYSVLSRQPTTSSIIEGIAGDRHDERWQSESPICPHSRLSTYRQTYVCTDDEPDDSMLSVAIRPDTSLTLGSTIHHMDSMIRSPGSDELQELSDVFKNNDSQQWPTGVEEMYSRLSSRSRNHSRNRRSRTSHSRSGTVLGDVMETPDEGQENYHRCRDHTHPSWGHGGHDLGYGSKPVLRYTSKASVYKLDPIIVPSHTCTECAMCNIYQQESESPGPPNTPITGQYMLDPSPDPPVSIRTPLVRGTKLTSPKPEVMQLSRVYAESPTDGSKAMDVS